MKKETLSETGVPATTKPKIKLPASGLASEILGRGEERSTPEDPVPNSLQATLGSDDIYAFAANLNRESESAASSAQLGPAETWVTFSAETESFALPVAQVQEILRVSTITRVPQAPPTVRGITNVRGRVIPVVDFRVRLGLDPIVIKPESRILVIESKNSLIGFLVESVQQVIRLHRSEIQEAPADIVTEQSDFYLGVVQQGGRLLILLNPDLVLAKRSQLQTAANL